MRSFMLAFVTAGLLVNMAPAAAQSETVAKRPELVVQVGHSSKAVVNNVSISPDGRLLASADGAGSLHIWDASTGNLLATLHHDKKVERMGFGLGGRLIASGSSFQIRLWDVLSSREAGTFSGNGETLAWTRDGAVLAFLSDRGIAMLDAATQKEIRVIPYSISGGYDSMKTLAFSPDGRRLAAGFNSGLIRQWDASSGAELPAIKAHPQLVTRVAFSPDGLTLASASWDTTVKLWNAASGAEQQTLSPKRHWVNDLAFSPDGRRLYSVASSTLSVWDTVSGRRLQEIIPAPSQSVASSPDGRWLAAGGAIGSVSIIDAATFSETRNLSSRVASIKSMALSADGRWMATGGEYYGKTMLWDLAAGSREQRLDHGLQESGHNSVISLAFAGRALMSEIFPSARVDRLRLWDPVTGQMLNSLAGGNEVGYGSITSANGRLIAYVVRGKGAGGLDNNVILWDPVTNTRRKIDIGQRQIGFALSADGRRLATAGDKTVKIWETETGQQLRSAAFSSSYCDDCLRFSPDGAMLLITGQDGLLFQDVATGRETNLGRPTATGRFKGNIGAYSPDTQFVLVSGSPTVLGYAVHAGFVIEVATGKTVATLSGHLAELTGAAFTANPCCAVTASADGITRIWNWRTGELLALALSVSSDEGTYAQRAMGGQHLDLSGEWLVVTPDGLFDGTPGAFRKMLWRFGENILDVEPLEIFFNEYFRPGLLAEIMAGKRPQAPRDISGIDRRQPRVMLSSTAGGGTPTGERMMTVRLEVEEAPPAVQGAAGSGARDLRLFRNGSLVKHWRGDVLSGKDRAVLEARIPVVAGDNQLTAYAFNRDNVKSSDAKLAIRGADSLKRQGTAYVLAIGVNKHANPDFDLRYAVTDATAFGAELGRAQSALRNYARVEQVRLFDREATKANILAALRRLAGVDTGPLPAGAPQALEKLVQAQPEDAVFVFFAGHGFADEPRFYLVPHDVNAKGPPGSALDTKSLQALYASAVSDLELEAAFTGIDVSQLLLVIDACNSGQVLDAEEKRRGPMNSKGLAQLAYEKGMYVLTAAQGHQAALEFEKLGHGLLTFVLVQEGLKTPAADRAPKDGAVVTREWLDYAALRVPRMQLELMQEIMKTGRSVAVVAGDEKIANVSARTLQRPRVFYRREPEAHPLVIVRQ